MLRDLDNWARSLSVPKYSAVNASQVTDSGSLVPKDVPQQCASREIGANPLVCHNSKYLSGLRVLFLSFGNYKLEKVILNVFMVIEQEFNATMQILGRSQVRS